MWAPKFTAVAILAVITLPHSQSFAPSSSPFVPATSRCFAGCKAPRPSLRPAVLGLRAQEKDSLKPEAAETKPEAKDGSVEKLLGFLGEPGAKMGRGIDWFFDTSTISGAKAWRLQQVPGEADATRFRGDGDVLEDMVRDQIDSYDKAGMNPSGSLSLNVGAEGAFSDTMAEGGYSMTDEDLGNSLTARLSQIALANSAGSVTEDESRDLCGAELALMCYKKYGLYHDMSLKCDKLQLVSEKQLISVNIYYSYFGQLNPQFPYTESQYLEKLDSIAGAVNIWGQQDYVRAFFREKPTAYRGLPSRPRWDTAVSIRLNKSPTWNDELAKDWFLT
mmetsp:Transcript_5273/g.8450  ORF Transcript_5273/g.8450 Transcript_5273/m.8450 type:complete len:333 (-) Transcript_5273:144-1142(-)|eukprot:CAMPEP_0184300940 /NCGR_PEP_ID=MMETSP1049-20130417/11248_1 /TAXON_ID=77928 /ORGANISM="Proteomonas sulcata, Strain CCMP704" /LENGTH=332 /DNA_ID=CAMNT_0026611795 /DNA_START=261 /DNA_END=1259 /DNA_ORIENTATION=+